MLKIDIWLTSNQGPKFYETVLSFMAPKELDNFLESFKMFWSQKSLSPVAYTHSHAVFEEWPKKLHCLGKGDGGGMERQHQNFSSPQMQHPQKRMASGPFGKGPTIWLILSSTITWTRGSNVSQFGLIRVPEFVLPMLHWLYYARPAFKTASLPRQLGLGKRVLCFRVYQFF